MARMIVHWDGTNVKLEGLAAGRPEPNDLPVIDHIDVPGKQDVLDWDGTKLVINAAKKAAYDAIDRRSPMEKLEERVAALERRP